MVRSKLLARQEFSRWRDLRPNLISVAPQVRAYKVFSRPTPYLPGSLQKMRKISGFSATSAADPAPRIGTGAPDAAHGEQSELPPRRPRGVYGAEFQPVRRRSPGGDRPQWRRQILAAAHDRRADPHICRAVGTSPAATTTPPLGEQAHYLGHLDALKPSLSVGENLQFWARFPRAPAAAQSSRPGSGRSCPASRPAGRLSVGRTAAAAVDRPPGRRAAADLAARRADLGARRAVAKTAGRI